MDRFRMVKRQGTTHSPTFLNCNSSDLTKQTESDFMPPFPDSRRSQFDGANAAKHLTKDVEQLWLGHRTQRNHYRLMKTEADLGRRLK